MSKKEFLLMSNQSRKLAGFLLVMFPTANHPLPACTRGFEPRRTVAHNGTRVAAQNGGKSPHHGRETLSGVPAARGGGRIRQMGTRFQGGSARSPTRYRPERIFDACM